MSKPLPTSSPSENTASASRAVVARLRVEFVLLYVALPLLVRQWVPGRFYLPVLWVTALLVALGLRGKPSPPRRRPWRLLLWGLLRRVGLTAVLLTGLLWIWQADWLLQFPRRDPWMWAMVMLFYPMVSVIPQGVLYRALFYQRYSACWGGGMGTRWMAALAFCLAHLVFNNPWALILTFPAGWILARSYEHSGSLALSNLEHALYGQLVFTIGWGPVLYHGTQAMAERLT